MSIYLNFSFIEGLVKFWTNIFIFHDAKKIHPHNENIIYHARILQNNTKMSYYF